MSDAGAKAVGLSRLPKSWTPEFDSIPASVVVGSETDLAKAADHLSSRFSGRSIIVRSSAGTESLADRGRFDSVRLPGAEPTAIKEALRKLSIQGVAMSVKMGAVVQAYHHPVMRGHLSNERRVSRTRNHWQVEVDHPTAHDFRINSQRDAPPLASRPISLRMRDLHRTLGGVGNWAARTFPSRAHLEWVFDGQTLWIVQLDLEDDAPDEGVNPRLIESKVYAGQDAEPDHSPALTLLEPWRAGAFPRYRKLRYVARFQAIAGCRYPQLYVLRGENVEAFLRGSDPAGDLRRIVGERLVCRTDLIPEAHLGFEGLNLPRTDTLAPQAIVDAVRAQLDDFYGHGVAADALVFIIHRFVPSIASAWAEATPGEALVILDALWGLPDGLQFLEHDSFEWDTKLNVLSAEHITYKDRFLHEEPDGSWALRPVKRTLARSASISKSDVAFMAESTRMLAEEMGHPLRVMWFVDTCVGAKVAPLIPWFCHEPHPLTVTGGPEEVLAARSQDRSQLRRLPARDIRSLADLNGVPPSPHRLRLLPTAENMRTNAFIDAVVACAKAGGHVVEMLGSGLAHAYYLIARTGVPIVVPSQRGHKRVRKLRTFGKLVRDGIPGKIRLGGEKAKTLRVPTEERRRALLSKLLEEAHEVAEATNPDDVCGELSDLLEVVRSLARNESLDWADVQRAADEKAALLGSFDGGQVLVETTAAGPGRDRRTQPADIAMGRIVKDASTTTIPHFALIGDSIDVSISGRDIRLAFTADGLTIEELGPETDDGQLRLPL